MADMKEKLVELLMQVEDNMCDDCGREPVGCAVVAIADHLIAHGVTVQEWISVKDRLPEYEQQVLTYRGEGGISIERMFPGAFWDFDYDIIDEVTHWMPLPPAPEDVK